MLLWALFLHKIKIENSIYPEKNLTTLPENKMFVKFFMSRFQKKILPQKTCDRLSVLEENIIARNIIRCIAFLSVTGNIFIPCNGPSEK